MNLIPPDRLPGAVPDCGLDTNISSGCNNMKNKDSVIEVLGKYRVYVEEYREPGHSETIIMVNGALATTVSFGQTVRYLRNNFNVSLFDLPYAGRSKQHNDNSVLLTMD